GTLSSRPPHRGATRKGAVARLAGALPSARGASRRRRARVSCRPRTRSRVGGPRLASPAPGRLPDDAAVVAGAVASRPAGGSAERRGALVRRARPCASAGWTGGGVCDGSRSRSGAGRREPGRVATGRGSGDAGTLGRRGEVLFASNRPAQRLARRGVGL